MTRYPERYLLSFQNAPPSIDNAAYLATEGGYNEIRSSVFDGFFFRPRTNNNANFTESLWTANAYSIADLSDDLAVLQAHNLINDWGRPRKNLVLVNTENTLVDWMTGNMGPVIQNLKLAGKFAQLGGFVGIFFDSEPYTNRYVWQYDHQPSRARFSFGEYESQVYDFAYDVARAWLVNFPGIKVFLSSGYYNYYRTLDLGTTTPEANEYGLYKAWLNGLYDGIGDGQFYITHGNLYSPIAEFSGSLPRIILSQEGGYDINPADIAVDYAVLKARTMGTIDPRYKGGSGYFDDLTDFCMALWVDSHPPTFDNAIPGGNKFSPAAISAITQYCLERDKWCWIFQEAYFFYEQSPTILEDYTFELREIRFGLGMW